MPRKRNAVGALLERFSYHATRATGTSLAFVLATAVILIWAITGPIFRFSDTWQLVINTGTTIVTFLMVFLIQRAQNKDALAIHLKLNEIVAALEGASNRLIDVEDLSEPEIEALRKYYKRLIDLAREDDVLTMTHSIEEAASRHGTKYKKPPKNTKSSNGKLKDVRD
ncbi:MAG TPA: low affinity iron permease family protein [Pyrinomonadaceae bacterium]|nr:low affinity iron permease family protein [Pyrinomonadaceae bacterium]